MSTILLEYYFFHLLSVVCSVFKSLNYNKEKWHILEKIKVLFTGYVGSENINPIKRSVKIQSKPLFSNLYLLLLYSRKIILSRVFLSKPIINLKWSFLIVKKLSIPYSLTKNTIKQLPKYNCKV